MFTYRYINSRGDIEVKFKLSAFVWIWAVILGIVLSRNQLMKVSDVSLLFYLVLSINVAIFMCWYSLDARQLQEYFLCNLENLKKRPICCACSAFSHQNLLHLVNNMLALYHILPEITKTLDRAQKEASQRAVAAWITAGTSTLQHVLAVLMAANVLLQPTADNLCCNRA